MKVNPYSDMDDKASRFAYLITGYIRNTLSEKEHDELDDLVNENDHNMQLFEDLTDEKNLVANLEWMDKSNAEESYRAMKKRKEFTMEPKMNLRSFWIFAASILVLYGIFLLYLFTDPKGKQKTVQDIVTNDSIFLKPGSNRATLTLANGKIIDLNNSKTGVLKSDSGLIISKIADGEIVYSKDINANDENMIHTLSTPAGGQYQVTLPDGTKVWLNAATSIKYPAAFGSKERKVELSGEAYFEVAKNEKKPFRVILEDSTTVMVTGTHFNVQSYKNEKDQQVTLLQGSVLVSNGNRIAKLQPGTQAIIKGQEITKIDVLDTAVVTGWKNGLFVFHDAPIQSIMMQIERWYDAKIIFQSDTKQLFNATILRKEPLTKVLKLLELNGYVHFKIKNQTIYVLP